MSKKYRTILTTDMECDDMNSMIHLALFLNEMDVQAFVYTSSQYHFNGDGKSTLGEATPHFRCQGEAAWKEKGRDITQVDPEAASLTSYRPFEEDWIEKLWDKDYRAVYENLKQHGDFPTPEELLSRTYLGNTAFEGDVRYPTPGSEIIKQHILDDDPRTLYLQSWGGVNTIVRAFMSIHEEHSGDPDWPQLYKKICDKVVILGMMNKVGQDNSYIDHMEAIFPDVKYMFGELGYGGFFSSKNTQADAIHMFQADWMKEHIKFGHGPLMERYILMGDGTFIYGEPDEYQFGLYPVIDWNIPGMTRTEFEPFDFLGEGDSNTYIPLIYVGLNGMDDLKSPTLAGRMGVCDQRPAPQYNWYTGGAAGRGPFAGSPNPYVKAYQHEFAARADWCVKDFAHTNHPPVVTVEQDEVCGAPGETVALKAQVKDLNGLPLHTNWTYYPGSSTYSGEKQGLRPWDVMDPETCFTIPVDAKPGDELLFILEVRNEAEHPITRYGQVYVKVK